MVKISIFDKTLQVHTNHTMQHDIVLFWGGGGGGWLLEAYIRQLY